MTFEEAEQQIANLNEIVLNQAAIQGMITRVVWRTFAAEDRPDVGGKLTWEAMFLEAAYSLSKDPKTDPRAMPFLTALGNHAPFKFEEPPPGPDLRVVR